MACGLYDRTFALYCGKITLPGFSLEFTPAYPPELFFQMITNPKFDISELSLSSYVMQKMARYDYLAIPVFPARRFRHSFIFVNSNSGIKEPNDLSGRRIGVYNYEITAAVWVRGFLEHDYGVKPSSMKWVTSKEERIKFARKEDLEINLVKDANLTGLLIDGRIDALISPILSRELLQSDVVRRLFEDYKRVESEYFSRTNIYPIMHTVVVREDLLKRHNGLSRKIVDAFRGAKRWWYDYLEDPEWQTNQLYFTWPMKVIEENRSVFGPDPFPYDIEQNRSVIETLLQYQYEQGLIDKIPDIEGLFDSDTIDYAENYEVISF